MWCDSTMAPISIKSSSSVRVTSIAWNQSSTLPMTCANPSPHAEGGVRSDSAPRIYGSALASHAHSLAQRTRRRLLLSHPPLTTALDIKTLPIRYQALSAAPRVHRHMGTQKWCGRCRVWVVTPLPWSWPSEAQEGRIGTAVTALPGAPPPSAVV